MNETAVSSEIELLLRQARALIEQGDQERALPELWRAEALARGDSVALQEILDFALDSDQWFGLALLVEALQSDISAATRSVAEEPQARGWRIGCLGMFLLSVVGGAAGLFLGAKIGARFDPPPDPNSLEMIGPIGHMVVVALVGLFVGACALPVFVHLLVTADPRVARNPRGPHCPS